MSYHHRTRGLANENKFYVQQQPPQERARSFHSFRGTERQLRSVEMEIDPGDRPRQGDQIERKHGV